jgi:hypothetical protein
MKAELKPKVYKFKVPKDIGACVDRMGALQLEINTATLNYTRITEPLKAEYDGIEEHLIKNIPKENLEGAIGKLYTVMIEHPSFPQVKDWAKLYAYIVKHNAFELLQKRPTVSAFRERWDAKVVVPGVEIFRDTKLKLSPRKAKT